MSDELATGLARFIDAWTDWASTATIADLKALAPAPWASVGRGAGGTAYALYYAARARGGDRQILLAAHRWWLAAKRLAAQPRGLRAGDLARVSVAGSAGFGMPGIHAVGALITHALGKARERDRAVDAFIASAPDPHRLKAEWMSGAAGLLTTALLLHRHTGAPRALPFANSLAQRLLTRGSTWPRGAAFAHGHAGVQHALLAWGRVTGADVRAVVAGIEPPSVERALASGPKALARSWCNGLAGFVLLWALMFEQTADERWLAAARAGVVDLEGDPHPPSGTLCCGVGGYAYAALALHHADRAGGWLDRARALTARALTDESLANGMQRGLPGLVWVASQV